MEAIGSEWEDSISSGAAGGAAFVRVVLSGGMMDSEQWEVKGRKEREFHFVLNLICSTFIICKCAS